MVPPVTLNDTEPILLLLQIILVAVAVALNTGFEFVTTAVPVLVHPFAEVTVTV